MATVNTPNVPPSLAAAYVKVVTTSNRWNSPQTIAGRNNLISPIAAKRFQLPLLTRYHQAADWLAERFAGSVRGRALVLWKAERVTEMLAHVWPPQYWDAITPASTRAMSYNVKYQPPLLGYQYSSEHSILADYVLPVQNTPPPNPSPGWACNNASGNVRDEWLTQLGLMFNLGQTFNRDTVRPLFLSAALSFDLTSNLNGNRWWAQATISSRAWDEWGRGWYADWRIHSYFRRQYRWAWIPETGTAPWSQTVTRRMVAANVDAHVAGIYATTNSLAVILCPQPPHGRYVGNNTTASCWLSADVTAYRARAS